MKKCMLPLLLLAALLLALTGCGEETLLDKNDPVTVNFWHVYGEQSGSPMDVLVQEFNHTVGQEQGVRVQVTNLSSASKIGGFLKEAQNGGDLQEMPDLFTCHISDATALGEENLVDWHDWFTQEELSDFVPGFLADGTAEDGKLLLFPISKSTQLLMCNGSGFDRFAQATGVSYDELATWEGFYDAAGQFYDWSGKPFCALDYPLRAVELCALERGSEDFYTEAIGTAEEWAKSAVGLEVDKDNLTHEFTREYRRSQFVSSAIHATENLVTRSSPKLAGAQAVAKKITDHANRLNELQRQLENAVGAKTNQNRQRILTQNRKLMMGGLQHDQELAADITLDVPVVDPDLCTSCGDCAKACVTHALDLDDSGHVHTLAAYCVNCAACVKACPEGALSMRPQDARGVSPTWEVGSEEELRALIGSESFWRFSHT